MITQFYIKNFRSIVNLELDFSYGEGKAPNGYQKDSRLPFLEATAQGQRSKPTRAVSVMAFYGQNAGGKSTIIAALDTLVGIIREGIAGKYHPNRLHPELPDATTFELEWITGQRDAGYYLYRYSITYNALSIISEKLTLGDTVLFLANHGYLKKENLSTEQSLVYTPEKLNEIFTSLCTDAKGMQVKPALCAINQQFPGLNSWLSLARNSIQVIHVFTNASLLPSVLSSANLDRTFFDNVDFEKVVKTIRRMDIDIERMYTRREFLNVQNPLTQIIEKKELAQIYVDHRTTDGQIESFRIHEESQGTQILLMLLCVLEKITCEHSTLVFDELDNALHPLLLREIVNRFTHKEHNRLNSQLIFTAHNTDLLDGQRLRSSEVGIVSKTRSRGTQVERLCDLNGVRNVDNFRKDYLNGEYAGIPFIASTCP